MNKLLLLFLLCMLGSRVIHAQCSTSIQSTLNPFCFSNCDGVVSMNTVGGTPPYTFTIMPAVGLQNPPGTFSQLCPGVYTITSMDANSCSATATIYMAPPPPIVINVINVIPPSCVPGCDGSAQVQVTGGVPGYTYSIQPSTATISMSGAITNMCANTTYSITVVDMNGCLNFSTFVTPTMNPPSLSATVFPDSCGISGLGSIYCNVAGGTQPFSYTCSGTATINGSAITGLMGGNTYTVTVTDAIGCTASISQTIGLTSNALTGVTATSVSYDASCNLVNDGGIDLTVNPSAGLTYQWNNGMITEDLANVPNGNYHVIISNGSGDCMVHTATIGVAGVNCGTVSGYVYLDSNSNCSFDIGDYYLPNRQVQLSTGDFTFTDMNGYYQFNNVPFGSHTVSQITTVPYYLNACTQASNVTLNASNNNSMYNNFKDSLGVQADEYVYLIGTRYIPGLAPTWVGAWIKIEQVNNSQYWIQNKVTLLLNDSLDFSSASITPANITPTPNGDSITWFVNIPPFSNWGNSATNEILVYINTPTNLSLGSLLTSCASVVPLNLTDINMLNNTTCISKLVATSFDPNDKSVQPEGWGPEGVITLQQNTLDYQIRFQNTGTAPAQNIEIIDTLSDKLDVSSLEVNGYSHPYQLEVLNGHILKFKFNNIMLPDSGSNLQGSMGYINYRIKQKATNQLGDVILNSAAIYFDYNSPIITNTTKNTIGLPLAVNGVKEQTTKLMVFPNPAHDKVFVILQEGIQSAPNTNTIEVVDITGKQVLRVSGAVKQGVTLDISTLQKGIYFVRCGQLSQRITVN